VTKLADQKPRTVHFLFDTDNHDIPVVLMMEKKRYPMTVHTPSDNELKGMTEWCRPVEAVSSSEYPVWFQDLMAVMEYDYKEA
jgi:hypothetical protein